MRRAEVLETTRSLFARKGYQRTTMVAVAAASEIALGTLYQVFPSKEAMLCSLLEDYIDRLIERGRQAAAGGGGAREQLVQRFGERIDDKYEEYLRLLESLFRRGVRDGDFVAGPPRRLAVTLAGMIHALVRRWLRERRLDLLAEGDALVELLLHGVVSEARR